MDVRGLMRRSAIFHAGREAVVHGDDRLTFKEAWERGLRLANGLLAEGRTRMFCQVSEQFTPPLLALVTVKVICVVVRDVMATEVPVGAALMFLLSLPVICQIAPLSQAMPWYRILPGAW